LQRRVPETAREQAVKAERTLAAVQGALSAEYMSRAECLAEASRLEAHATHLDAQRESLASR